MKLFVTSIILILVSFIHSANAAKFENLEALCMPKEEFSAISKELEIKPFITGTNSEGISMFAIDKKGDFLSIFIPEKTNMVCIVDIIENANMNEELKKIFRKKINI